MNDNQANSASAERDCNANNRSVELYSNGLESNKNYQQEIASLTPNAGKGCAKSQYELGMLYLDSQGLVEDPEAAAKYWLTKSADQGYCEAQLQIGKIHLKSPEVEGSIKKAYDYFNNAASIYYDEPYFYLGIMHTDPQYGLVDHKKATNYFKKVYRYIEPGDLYKISKLYQQQNDETSNNLAVEFLEKAASMRHAEAQYEYALSLQQKKTPYSIEWFKKAAEQKHLKAQLRLGEYYICRENNELAMHWYSQAADQKSIEAYYALGLLNARILKFKSAYHYYKAADDKGHVGASYKLGIIYYLGQGVQIDQQKALKYFEKAANRRNPKAQYNLAVHYLQNPKYNDGLWTGVNWLKKAAEQDIKEACFLLGCMSAETKYAPYFQDPAATSELAFKKAAHLGDPRAAARIKEMQNLNRIIHYVTFQEALETSGISSDNYGNSPCSHLSAERIINR